MNDLIKNLYDSGWGVEEIGRDLEIYYGLSATAAIRKVIDWVEGRGE